MFLPICTPVLGCYKQTQAHPAIESERNQQVELSPSKIIVMCFPKVMQYQVEKNDFLGRPGTSYKFKMQMV